MIALRSCKMGLATLVASLAWFGGTVASRAADNLEAKIINIDFNGAQNNAGPRGPGPTYLGQGAAGGGNVWNGIVADARLSDGYDNQNITSIGSDKLVNSAGETTGVSLVIGPVGGDCPNAGADPGAAEALFGDYCYVGNAGANTLGGRNASKADFTISGLGAAASVDLYFYYGYNGNISVAGASPAAFGGSGIFTPANTIYFANVPVVNGTVTGTVGNGSALIVLDGMTIQMADPLPQPFIKSAEPTGSAVQANAPITIQLQDNVTQVVPGSVQLLVNGEAVAATVSKPAGSATTSVTYTPASNWAPGSINTFRIIFGDNATPAVVQTSDFTFSVLNETVAGVTINIDFSGAQNTPVAHEPGPTFIGQGAAGGGTRWNGILADTRLTDGSDDPNLTVSGDNLVNSLGQATTVGFTIYPVGGDSPNAGTVSTAAAALFGDFLYAGFTAQAVSVADFTISGLGTTPTVDLYFYYGGAERSAVNGNFVIPGASPATFAARGVFTPANTIYFAKVGVTNGTITGTMGNGSETLLYGLTIQKALPQPYIISASPTGVGVRVSTALTVELQDYVTQVVPASVQLQVNGQVVAATVSKPAGSAVTTVTYAPASGWAQGSTNTFKITFSDDAASPVVQTADYSFVVLNEALAAATINIDFTGAQNFDWGNLAGGGRGPGPTYVGLGAAGGGIVWNGILADQRLPDGGDDRNITVITNNLVNSLGEVTTVGFTIGPVSSDDPAGGTDPTATAALFGDYLYVGYGGQTTGMADFTISGLGTTPYVDLYFYYGSAGNFVVPGATATPFVARGIFTPGNTICFAKVAVTNGTVTGTMGTGPLTQMFGMTIQEPLPQPFIKSAGPTGLTVRANTSITVELQDYITQIVPSALQLLVNGQLVTPTISKPAGSAITTVTYIPAGGWVQGSANTFRIVFGDSASPPVVQTNDFTFTVLNEALAAATINIDFTGAQNFDWGNLAGGGRGPGPTYIGQGAAGGDTTWNGILADQRLPDGSDDRNITVSTNNLVNSLGEVTTVGFTIGPVSSDDPAGGTDPTATAALFGDYLYVGYGGQTTGMADFTISGLGTAPYVDLYFYYGYNGNFVVPGASATPFVAKGIFTPGNTIYFAKVAVANGTVTGTMGTGPLTTLNGMTIQKLLSQPGPLSISRQGAGIILSWPGSATLQAADQLTGPWSDMGTSSPQTITPTAGHKFYRLKQ